MGYPARQKKRDCSFREIERIEQQRARVNKVARVIQHHDHHHDAAQQID